jgi:hypothetical protein
MIITTRLCRSAAIETATVLLLAAAASAQQTAPPGCAWNMYLSAQDAVKQGKIDFLRPHEKTGARERCAGGACGNSVGHPVILM